MIKHFPYEPSDTPGRYEICYGNDADTLSAYLKPFVARHSSYIYIVDKNLPAEILDTVVAMTGISPTSIVKIDPAKKNIDHVIEIWNHMVKEVPQAAIAIGGGVIGDLSGLASGTYQRGIPRIYFPTTILSMVDASIGGKSGIDHTDVKNSIGVLHYPDVVINYVPFLRTLEDGEYNSGFGEVIKAAVLYDRTFFEKLEKLSVNGRLSEEDLIDVLHESSILKTKVCEEPNNQKLSLLYGHAIGHAYEKLVEGRRRHGDCVAIGMNTEGALSVLAGYWNRDEWERQRQVIRKFNLPTDLPTDTDLDSLMDKMAKYKKLVDNDNLYFVLPDRFGHVVNQEKGCRTGFKRSEVKKFLSEVQDYTHNS